VSSGNGVLIAGGSIDVTLRGLTINGQGGNVGIFYTLGASLHIDHCVVSHMTGNGIQIGFGGDITIADSVIRENGGAGLEIGLNPRILVERTRLEKNGGRGINFQPTVAGGSKLAVHDSVIAGNNSGGIYIYATTPFVGGADVTLSDSMVTRNGGTGIYLRTPIRLFAHRNTVTGNYDGIWVDYSASATLTDNVIGGNTVVGLLAHGADAAAIIDHNTVSGQMEGLSQQNSGVIVTRSNNTVHLNTTDVVNGPLWAIGGI
jgi:parallel beta-helix repeat protein